MENTSLATAIAQPGNSVPPRIEELRIWMINTIPCSPNTEEVRDELRALSLDDLLIHFLNWDDRRISQRRRQVSYTNDFWTSAAMSHAESVLKIAQLVENGDDMTPYLSERVAEYGYLSEKIGRTKPRRGIEWRDKDLALNAFDIHHLHLGKKITPNGWIKRTDELLFVCFEREKATFLVVGNHKSFDDGTAEKAAARWRSGGGNLEINYSDEDLKRLHRAGVNTTNIIDGCPFIGSELTGAGTRQPMYAFHVLDRLDQHEEKLDQPGWLAENIPKFATKISDTPSFTWRIWGCELYLIEETTKKGVRLTKWRR